MLVHRGQCRRVDEHKWIAASATTFMAQTNTEGVWRRIVSAVVRWVEAVPPPRYNVVLLVFGSQLYRVIVAQEPNSGPVTRSLCLSYAPRLLENQVRDAYSRSFPRILAWLFLPGLA